MRQSNVSLFLLNHKTYMSDDMVEEKECIYNWSGCLVEFLWLQFIISSLILSSQTPVMPADQRLNQTTEFWLIGSWNRKQTRIQPWKCTDVQLSHILYFTDCSEFAGESDLCYPLCSSCYLFPSDSRICQDVRIVLLWYTRYSD